jgi:hypothetical protein
MRPTVDATRDALERLTRSAAWPPRWLTIPEFVAELDRQGFWTQRGAGLSERTKQCFLRFAFAWQRDRDGMPVWARVGFSYLHSRLLAEEP